MVEALPVRLYGVHALLTQQEIEYVARGCGAKAILSSPDRAERVLSLSERRASVCAGENLSRLAFSS